MPCTQPFAGPISRLGWPTSPPSTAGPPPLALEDPPVGGGTVGTPVHNGGFTSAMHGMHSSASKASGPISTHMGIFGKVFALPVCLVASLQSIL